MPCAANSGGVYNGAVKVTGAVVLAISVFALMTIARIHRYCPQQTLVPHLSSATKVNENRAGIASEAVVRGVVHIRREEAPVAFLDSFLEAPRPPAFLILRPFEFRPPPTLA